MKPMVPLASFENKNTPCLGRFVFVTKIAWLVGPRVCYLDLYLPKMPLFLFWGVGFAGCFEYPPLTSK